MPFFHSTLFGFKTSPQQIVSTNYLILSSPLWGVESVYSYYETTNCAYASRSEKNLLSCFGTLFTPPLEGPFGGQNTHVSTQNLAQDCSGSAISTKLRACLKTMFFCAHCVYTGNYTPANPPVMLVKHRIPKKIQKINHSLGGTLGR